MTPGQEMDFFDILTKNKLQDLLKSRPSQLTRLELNDQSLTNIIRSEQYIKSQNIVLKRVVELS